MPLCRCLPAGTGPGSKGVWAPNGRFVTMTRLFARWPLPVAVVLALLLQGALAAPCAAHGWKGHISKTKTVTVTTTTTKTCGTIAPVAVQPVAPVYAPAAYAPAPVAPVAGYYYMLQPARSRPSPRWLLSRRRPQPTFSCPPALPRWPRHRSSPSPRRPSSRGLCPRGLCPGTCTRRWPTSLRLCIRPPMPQHPSRRLPLSLRLMPRHPRPRWLPLHLYQLRR